MATLKESFFNALKAFLLEEVDPLAEQLDSDSEALKIIFNKFKQLGGVRLLVPQRYGGLGGAYQDWARCNVLLAQHSAALLFLQTQHQSALTKLAANVDTAAKERLYQQIVDQQLAIGTVNRPGQPLTVFKEQQHFRLSGFIPWATGYQFFEQLLCRFNDEQRIYFSLVPFHRATHHGGEIDCSEVIDTTVVSSVNTVKIQFNQWLIKDDAVLLSLPVSDAKSLRVVHSNLYSLAGVSQALLEEVTRSRQFSINSLLQARHQALVQALAQYHQAIFSPIDNEHRLRAKGLAMANACVLLLRLSMAGKCLLADQRADRLSREVDLYTCTGFNEAVLEACLQDFNFVVNGQALGG